MDDHSTAKEIFARLDSVRSEVLNRGTAASELTIPSILPADGHTENSKLPTPYQGLGARAVNNLAAKIMLALFPPNTAFFKFALDEEVEADLAAAEDRREEIEAGLAKIERRIVSHLESTRIRPVASLALKNLITTGNGVIHVDSDGDFRFFSVRNFVCIRDPKGTPVDLVVKECVSPFTLDEEILRAAFSDAEIAEFRTDKENSVDLYTRQYLKDKQYHVYQELNGEKVEGSTGTYPMNAPAFIPLRWTNIHGEDYGRGMVEEYIGDFIALDDLTRDILKASAQAAKIVWMLDPNSHTRAQDLERAESGDVLYGSAEDVGTVGLEKYGDFQISLAKIHDLEKDLASAFLMHSSIQRDAERVTAEEVRYMAQELEDALGGVYSILAQDFQVPLLNRIVNVLKKKGKIPPFPKDAVNFRITTGLEALGRSHDASKTVQFIQTMASLVGERFVQRMDVDSVSRMLGASMGVDASQIVMDEKKFQKTLQTEQMQQLLQGAGPGVLQELTKQKGAQPQ